MKKTQWFNDVKFKLENEFYSRSNVIDHPPWSIKTIAVWYITIGMFIIDLKKTSFTLFQKTSFSLKAGHGLFRYLSKSIVIPVS